MAIQIDHMETSVEITAPTAATRPPTTPPASRADDPAGAPGLRDAVMQILADELGNFRRMRGH